MNIKDLLKGDADKLASMAQTVATFKVADLIGKVVEAQPTQRERLAAAALQGILARGVPSSINEVNNIALLHADDLIKKLNGDNAPAQDNNAMKDMGDHVEVTIECDEDGRYTFNGTAYETVGEAMRAARDTVMADFEACGECPGCLAAEAQAQAAQDIADKANAEGWHGLKTKTRHYAGAQVNNPTK